MKYLKTYYSINESKLDNLSLDGFIDIMRDITDSYDHRIEYIDNNKEEFYDCWIYLNGLEDPDVFNPHQFQFLQDIAHCECPTDINNMVDFYDLNIKDKFNDERDILLDNIEYLKNRLDLNNKVLEVVDILEQYIIPRFMEFSNFHKSTLGFESVIHFAQTERLSIRISFDIR